MDQAYTGMGELLFSVFESRRAPHSAPGTQGPRELIGMQHFFLRFVLHVCSNGPGMSERLLVVITHRPSTPDDFMHMMRQTRQIYRQ